MYIRRACGSLSCCAVGFHDSPFISVNNFLSLQWCSGRLQMDRHLRTPAEVPTQCSSDARLFPSHKPKVHLSSNLGMSAAFPGSLKCTTSANSATCPWYGRPRSLSYGVFPSVPHQKRQHLEVQSHRLPVVLFKIVISMFRSVSRPCSLPARFLLHWHSIPSVY